MQTAHILTLYGNFIVQFQCTSFFISPRPHCVFWLFETSDRHRWSWRRDCWMTSQRQLVHAHCFDCFHCCCCHHQHCWIPVPPCLCGHSVQWHWTYFSLTLTWTFPEPEAPGILFFFFNLSLFCGGGANLFISVLSTNSPNPCVEFYPSTDIKFRYENVMA